MQNNKINITDYLNVQYKKFANYSIERSLPGIDGFTIVRRKVLWTLHKSNISQFDKRKKLSWISNMTSALTTYQHAESAMEESINKMLNSYTGSNNVSFLSADGQAGNILDPTPGSARYVKAYLNDNFSKYFDKTDLELCLPKFEDGEYIEPDYLRPKLPLIVLNGASGTAFAYKTNIYSYNINDVINIMRAYLLNGEVLEDNLVPYYEGYKGVITKNPVTKQITIKGKFEKIDDNRYIINISELPINWTQEKYRHQILNKLKLKRVIRDYDDESKPDGWNINVYCTKEFYEKDRFVIMKELGLIKNDTETLVVNTPDQLNQQYDSIVDIITHFCDFRIKWTDEKRTRDIENVSNKLKLKQELLRFIEFWNANADLNKLTKTQLSTILVDNNFHRTHIEGFLKIPVLSLTKTKVSELQREIAKLIKELKKLENTPASAMIESTLNEFEVNSNIDSIIDAADII